ncbi:hypothetical protein CCAX7_003320 [Capsulimonas corticalis]|uniref:Thioredoxin domain-containing protein n=2 Tax=Capsulimonas corticalis TaxID=2219043 RepID=A0A9N7Q914_9BACT|nr:hypothetical protein CCAX7_003320 [Capsulimonas corticalis]
MAATVGILWSVMGGAHAAENAPHLAPATMRATGLDGKARLLPLRASRATVLVFLLSDCPVCNRYAPEIQRLEADYRRQGVDIDVVYEDSDLTRTQALRHAKAYGLTCGLLYDPAHMLARQAGAGSVPEAVVLSSDGAALYHGRIDDRFQHFGMANPAPAHRDLRSALDSVLTGAPVAVTQTPVVGCVIPKD